MNMDITLDDSTQPTRDRATPLLAALYRLVIRFLALSLMLGLLGAAWHVHHNPPYATNSDLAYYLGLVGGSLMLALLIYPLRKRFRALQWLGPVRWWFRFHMFAGVAGPLLVLFHSTFRVQSLNATITMGSMLLVVASGIVGRVLYRRIHRGLYGRRATLQDMRQELEGQLLAMQASSNLPDEIKQQIERFARLVPDIPVGRWQRIRHFMLLGMRRRRAFRRARRSLSRHSGSSGQSHTADTHALLEHVDATMRAAQRTAQFTSFERLFSLWHTVHIPFLFMLLFTAIVHVIAVHAY